MGDNCSAKDLILKLGAMQSEPAMKGWLSKWTNYVKRYQRRWFVLQNGHLSYYRADNNRRVPRLSIRRRRRSQHGNQAEMSHTCRGSISLHGAQIHALDSCTFVISNGGTQTFYIKASSEKERQEWLTALELAKTKIIQNMESEEDDEDIEGGSGSEELNGVRKLEEAVITLRTIHENGIKSFKMLLKLLVELEEYTEVNQTKTKEIAERVTVFRTAVTAIMNACEDCLKLTQEHTHKWQRCWQHDREQRQRLQDMVETLAQQHSKLEQAATHQTNTPAVNVSDEEYDLDDDDIDDIDEDVEGNEDNNAAGDRVQNAQEALTRAESGGGCDDEDNEFFDALAENGSSNGSVLSSWSANSSSNDTKVPAHIPEVPATNETDGNALCSSSFSNMTSSTSKSTTLIPNQTRQRRTRVPDKPNSSHNLWNIMKNCIGKDLSKIPMPVNFSEPLSMLQRLTEDYEYSDILDRASRCTDSLEQLAYVAAFTISSYSTTSNRTGKPFNPLLGETYECDRTDDMGWRAISEQVSHHPPMVAQHCESIKSKWRCWQEFTMTSKFRGKYLQVVPLGMAHVQFDSTKNKYSWRKVTTTVHNIIVGKLWVDQHGDMEILGKGGRGAEGLKCQLKFIPYSYFSRDSQRRVRGVVMDANDIVKWLIVGTWDEKVEIAPVIGASGPPSNPVYETGPTIVAWQRRMPPPDAEKYYGFTIFAAQLNEMEDGIAPTDSRLRPDQRLMEDGKWDEANVEKLRLEEKQRATRRRREAETEEATAEGRPYQPYLPVWFEQRVLDGSDGVAYEYKNEYWQCKQTQSWSRCPDIF